MTIRFWKRVNLIPGVRANFSKGGISLSLGGHGMWYTFGTRGRRATIGIPGSGLYWTEHIPPARPATHGHRFLFIVIILILVFASFVRM